MHEVAVTKCTCVSTGFGYQMHVCISINSALRATGTDLALRATKAAKPPCATPWKVHKSSPPRSTTTASAPVPRHACSARRKPRSPVRLPPPAAVNTNWPLHKLSALDDLKAACLLRGHWREEGNHAFAVARFRRPCLKCRCVNSPCKKKALAVAARHGS